LTNFFEEFFSGGHFIDLHNSEAFQKRVGGGLQKKVYKKGGT